MRLDRAQIEKQLIYILYGVSSLGPKFGSESESDNNSEPVAWPPSFDF